MAKTEREIAGQGLKIKRFFTKPGVHPYDEVEWEIRDAVIPNFKEGGNAFEQRAVEFPATWSQNATNIVAQKYFRGPLGTPQRERSVRQLIDRVADTITAWGWKDGYFATDEDREIFNLELKKILVTQKAAFNSPVFFNIGVEPRPQASACFILAVEDTMSSILNWYVEEGTIFKGGSGSGINLSTIRSSKETLSSGGEASGPVSFMRGADASAGTIKSGGKCFRRGTRVATPDGWRPIESLKLGDLVLTHAGPRPVLDFMPNGLKQCYRVRTCEGYEVEVTQGHKFAFWDVAHGTFRVKPIEEFTPGEALYVLVEPSLEGRDVPLRRPDFHDPANATTIEEIDFPSELNEELAYVLGLLYGDGELRTENPYRVRVSFAKDEAGYASAERFRKHGLHLFGEEPIVLGDFSGYQVLGYTRKRLVQFLAANGIAKGKAANLGFPTSLFEARPQVRAAFVAGVVDADGTYQARGGWSISCIDREFLVELQRLLLSLGVPSKIKINGEQAGTWRSLYRLSVVGYTFVSRLTAWLERHSAKAALNYTASPGADKGWGFRPSLYRALRSRATRGAGTLVERTVGDNETTGYGAMVRLTSHPDADVARYAETLTRCVQVRLESVDPAGQDETYDIEVDDTHLLSANGLYASNTRRAAKMVVLNVDHPDVEEFIWCKAIEERKARVLRDAGFDMDLDGRDSHSTQYQNANNSVRVTDDFMMAYIEDRDWALKAVTTGDVLKVVRAHDLMREVAQAAWECADPGMQYDTTTNAWHTCPNSGRINASNPCSEYLHLDNSACNLASLNLMKFLNDDDSFDIQAFRHAIDIVFLAQEIIVGNSSYPTPKIERNAKDFRQLGLGFANLGALLMARGIPYDSDAGRAWAGAITALMTGWAYRASALFADKIGPFAGFAANRDAMLAVMRKHRTAADQIDPDLVPEGLLQSAKNAWDDAVALGERHGYRNSQASVIAPTGCLVGGSLVPTERGLVRLRSLGDPGGARWQELAILVGSDEGPRKATKFYVNGLEPVVDVTTWRGYRIQGTPRHRIKIVDRSGGWVWKHFADIREGDVVPLALDQLVGMPQLVELPPLSDAYWTGEHHARAPRSMTAELAEFVGYFMGDGSLHSRGIRLCVARQDFEVVEHLARLGKELFGLEAHVTEKVGYTELAFHSVRLVQWWEACGFAKHAPPGHSGKGFAPHIPDAVLHTNDREVYAAFLRGLFEADGTVTAGYPHWATTSFEFSHDVQSLLLALGFPTTRKVDTTGWSGSKLAVLRLLNSSYNSRWLQQIGFLSGRKSSAVMSSENRQAARADRIPFTRALVDRLAPKNDRLRKVLLMEIAREGAVSRRVATELHERTNDSELARLLSFFYDGVASSELGEEQLTYDLSVPDNVTYIANGFVSHNTIGLMMDCDTTGVEPDLALVKTKKLVGGGTMRIVNQTVPRALKRLGYAPDEVEEIVTYIHEHNTPEGAPHLREEHYPVFDCAMGDRSIHYMGHVKMMAAVQPFISGAISKTTNMPESVTVEEVENLFVEGWRLGLKALAIYRDNCKVAQPLSADKKKAAKAAEPAVIATGQPQRRRLPKSRPSTTTSFRVGDQEGYVTAGSYPDNGLGEIFIKAAKQGSTLSGVMDALAISVSMGLQYGVPLEVYVSKFMNMQFPPSGMTDDPDVRFATSLVDYISRRLAIDYLDEDSRARLGIRTTEERREAVAGGNGKELPQVAAEPAPSEARDEAEGIRLLDAPYCYNCGNRMRPSGSCFVCEACGSTSGCS